MSAGYYISEFFSSIGDSIGDIGEGVAGVVAGVGGVVLGAAGAGLAAAAGTVALAGNAAFQIGRTAVEIGADVVKAVKILKEEKRIEEAAWIQYKNISRADRNQNAIIDMTNKIAEQFKHCGSVVDYETALNYIGEGQTPQERFEIASKLLTIQSKFKMMSNNFYSLSEASEKINFNIDEILIKYHNLRNNSFNLNELENIIMDINSDINDSLRAQKDLIEEAIRNKTFNKIYLQISNTEPNLFISVFSNELMSILKKPENNKELQDLAKRKELNDLQAEIFEMIEVARGLQGFEEKSSKLLQLFGSCIQLGERSDISFEDYLDLIELKRKTMRSIIRELQQNEAVLYRNKQLFLRSAHENARLRNLLNMDLPNYVFNSKTAIRDIEKLQSDNTKLNQEYKTNNFAKYISGELRARYIKQNYQYIPCDKEEKNEYTTIHKSYFLTPDGENVLCIHVNSDGDISEQVVGLKVFGLTKDAKSIYEAQENFCDHSKKIFKDLINQLGIDGKALNFGIHKPDASTSREVSFEGVLPQYIINKVTNARVARKNEQLKHRHVGGK